MKTLFNYSLHCFRDSITKPRKETDYSLQPSTSSWSNTIEMTEVDNEAQTLLQKENFSGNLLSSIFKKIYIKILQQVFF